MLNEARRAESRRQAREQFDREYGEASSAEPSPHDSLGLIEAARRNWEADPSLRVEFGDDFARYAAFYRADKKGLVRILSRPT